MISRKAHKRICRMNNRLRGERQMLRLSVRALSGNPLKETERRALAKRQAFIESLKGTVEERLARLRGNGADAAPVAGTSEEMGEAESAV